MREGKSYYPFNLVLALRNALRQTAILSSWYPWFFAVRTRQGAEPSRLTRRQGLLPKRIRNILVPRVLNRDGRFTLYPDIRRERRPRAPHAYELPSRRRPRRFPHPRRRRPRRRFLPRLTRPHSPNLHLRR